MAGIGEARERLARLEAQAAAREATRAAAAAHAQTRKNLEASIRAAHVAGVPQTQIAADAGFTRQWIRRLLSSG